MGRRNCSPRVRVTAPLFLTASLCAASLCAAAAASAEVRVAGEQMVTRTQAFDTNPNWDGRNNRSSTPPVRTVTQNFGHKATANAGGAPGEVGGLINPAGEAAYYAKPFAARDFEQPLSASGKMKLDGGGHTLLGFFNGNTVNEWRTPNSVVLRLYGRGTHFLAYPEYGTGRWRAGSGGEFQFPSNQVLDWTLNYDPAGSGTITAVIGNATVGGQTMVAALDPGHRLDGAAFDHFGLLNVNKSHDSPGQVWIDDVSINGGPPDPFNANPAWDALRNNTTYSSANVRFRFNFGYSATNNAGGARPGEIGGDLFRGDSRQASTMAYYGDRLDETLTLDDPLAASGKVSFHRGVTDSTTHIGFFHSTDSVRVSAAQASAVPENFLGVTIEGPSSEGFNFYPTYGLDTEAQGSGGNRGPSPPYIYPDGSSHDWSLTYDPTANGGLGAIFITLDGRPGTMLLRPGDKEDGAHFDRFGIITTHIDGNGQTVYFDDLTYTVGFVVPEPAGCAAALVLMLVGFNPRGIRRAPR